MKKSHKSKPRTKAVVKAKDSYVVPPWAIVFVLFVVAVILSWYWIPRV